MSNTLPVFHDTKQASHRSRSIKLCGSLLSRRPALAAHRRGTLPERRARTRRAPQRSAVVQAWQLRNERHDVRAHGPQRVWQRLHGLSGAWRVVAGCKREGGQLGQLCGGLALGAPRAAAALQRLHTACANICWSRGDGSCDSNSYLDRPHSTRMYTNKRNAQSALRQIPVPCMSSHEVCTTQRKLCSSSEQTKPTPFCGLRFAVRDHAGSRPPLVTVCSCRCRGAATAAACGAPR